MNPLTVYQRALDTVSQAVLAGEFDCYAAQIDMPYLVHTRAARLLVASIEDLRPTFDNLCRALRARGVTHYERVARAADYVSPRRIEGLHFTHALADAAHVLPPHESRQVLVRRGEDWRFTEAHYPIMADTWPVPAHLLFPEPGFGAGA